MRAHAGLPLVRHQCQHGHRHHQHEDTTEDLASRTQPQHHRHRRNRQKGAARLRAQRGDSRQQHQQQQAIPYPTVDRDHSQVVQQRHGHHHGQADLVVALDEAARRPPDPLPAAAEDGEDPPLETVEADRQRVDPDEQFDVLALADGGQRDHRHDLDLQHLHQLSARVAGVVGEDRGDAHPADEQQQRDHFGLPPGHAQLVLVEGQRDEGRPRRCGGERCVERKTPGQLVRVHDADPGPQQHGHPGAAHRERQDRGEHQQQQHVTHGRPPWPQPRRASHG